MSQKRTPVRLPHPKSGKFYLELLWQGTSTLLLGALAVAALWIGRVLMSSQKNHR